jgi:hypothetical protein
LLACSERHIINVFRMLGRQRSAAHLRGLEARLLKPWHVDYLCCIWPAALWFAYDEPEDYEPLRAAGRMLWEAGFTNDRLYCYCLIGQPRDTYEGAETRLRRAWSAGFMPFPMLWRDDLGKCNQAFSSLQRWCRPAFTKKVCARENIECVQNQRTTAAA